MPFPLAHPAAVLPLRRFGTTHLSFAALVTGSIVPDIAYFADDYSEFSKVFLALTGRFAKKIPLINSQWDWSEFSHSIAGSVLFCLPIGLLIQAGFYYLRVGLVGTFPNPHRQALAPLCIFQKKSFWVVVLSLVIGIWIHLFWDLFTHDNVRAARTWELVQGALNLSSTTQRTVQRMVWIGSSAGGVVALVMAYLSFLKRNKLSLWVLNSEDASRYFLWLGVLGIPALIAWPTIQASSYRIATVGIFAFFHAFAELYLVILGCCVLLLGSIFKLKHWPINPVERTDV